MKSLLLAFAIAAPVFAQDPAPPAEKPAPPVEKPAEKAKPAELPPLPVPSATPERLDLLKGQPGPRLAPLPDSPPSLIPDFLPPTAKPGRKDKATMPGVPPRGRSTLTPPKTAEDLDARIRYRQAQSKAANDPAIQAMWKESRDAGTDFEKRDALKRYYTALYKKMLALDKGIAPLIGERRPVALRRLDQTRVEPTDPLDEEHRQRRE